MLLNPPSKTNRLTTLPDAVYAIVVTLLVLDLKVPEIPGAVSNAELAADLISQFPNFVAYIISFIVIAYFWMNHHRLFSSLIIFDQKSSLLNLLHILFITLIPYTTSLIGHYKDDQIAVVLFSANIGLAALSLILLYLYVGARAEWHDGERAVHLGTHQMVGHLFWPSTSHCIHRRILFQNSSVARYLDPSAVRGDKCLPIKQSVFLGERQSGPATWNKPRLISN